MYKTINISVLIRAWIFMFVYACVCVCARACVCCFSESTWEMNFKMKRIMN